MDMPIACSLNEAERRERRKTILESVRADVVEVGSLSDGYSYKFAAKPEMLSKLAQLVTLEHECCEFLTFKIIVEAGDSPICLEVTGPSEAKQVIADFFGGPPT